MSSHQTVKEIIFQYPIKSGGPLNRKGLFCILKKGGGPFETLKAQILFLRRRITIRTLFSFDFSSKIALLDKKEKA